jgi:hypothetical protein
VAAADLTVQGAFVSALTAESLVAAGDIIVNRALISTLSSASTVSTPLLVTGNQRPLTSELTATSTLLQSNWYVERGLLSEQTADTTTIGRLRVLREIASALAVDSSVADVDLSVTKLLGISSPLVAASAVEGLRQLRVTRPVATGLEASSYAYAETLAVSRLQQTALTAASTVRNARLSTNLIQGLITADIELVGLYGGPYLDSDALLALPQPSLEVESA